MVDLKGKIGLEIHGYPVTKEKLFCKCKASREKGLKGNVNVCPICTGQPGAKPMRPNLEAVKKAIQVALMLNCKVNDYLIWKRKHYDWPDLPKGYQNTFSGSGAVPVGESGEFYGKGIWSMHLEEDPASWDPKTGRVDYNRSGLPLLEIVTAPDFVDSGEVMGWLKRLVASLGYLKAVDKNAGIKVDVNVSVPGKSDRVEIKNISSIEDIGRAIDYEIERQMKEGGGGETRRFDSVKGKTMKMRSKEDAEDYRFISDPDLINLGIEKKLIKDLEKGLPESPEEKLEKFIKKHKIGKKDAEVLAKNIDIAEFFEKVVEEIRVEFALSWVTVELLRHLNYNKVSLDEIDLKVEDFVSLLKLVRDKKITELQGKQILNKFYPKSFDPSKEAKDNEKISDEKELEKIIEKILKGNKRAVEDYKNGEEKSFNFLMGQVMRESEKRADFAVARKVLERKLNE